MTTISTGKTQLLNTSNGTFILNPIDQKSIDKPTRQRASELFLAIGRAQAHRLSSAGTYLLMAIMPDRKFVALYSVTAKTQINVGFYEALELFNPFIALGEAFERDAIERFVDGVSRGTTASGNMTLDHYVFTPYAFYSDSGAHEVMVHLAFDARNNNWDLWDEEKEKFSFVDHGTNYHSVTKNMDHTVTPENGCEDGIWYSVLDAHPFYGRSNRVAANSQSVDLSASKSLLQQLIDELNDE